MHCRQVKFELWQLTLYFAVYRLPVAEETSFPAACDQFPRCCSFWRNIYSLNLCRYLPVGHFGPTYGGLVRLFGSGILPSLGDYTG